MVSVGSLLGLASFSLFFLRGNLERDRGRRSLGEQGLLRSENGRLWQMVGVVAHSARVSVLFQVLFLSLLVLFVVIFEQLVFPLMLRRESPLKLRLAMVPESFQHLTFIRVILLVRASNR